MEKWGIGIFCLLTLGYFLTPLIYRAMKKHDYDNLYEGLQTTKAQAGSVSENPKKKRFVSYSDKYLMGEVN